VATVSTSSLMFPSAPRLHTPPPRTQTHSCKHKVHPSTLQQPRTLLVVSCSTAGCSCPAGSAAWYLLARTELCCVGVWGGRDWYAWACMSCNFAGLYGVSLTCTAKVW
jgi:hypothetical protein